MIFKFALLALVIYILYRFFINDKRKLQEKEKKEKEERIKSQEMARDPVCGTYVDKDSAITVRNGDNVFYFCSYECRQKYIDNVNKQKSIEE